MELSSHFPRLSRPAPAVQPELSHVSRLVQRWGKGDEQAFDELVPIVYDQLRQLARQRLRNDGDRHSLNTNGLVHEAYLRLLDSPRGSLQDRNHFLALASRVMRHLLVDRARARKAGKRGAGAELVELDESLWFSVNPVDVTDLDDALTKLAQLDERQSRMLELRYFGGLSLEETASALEVSLATVKRELRSARAWLAVELGTDGED